MQLLLEQAIDHFENGLGSLCLQFTNFNHLWLVMKAYGHFIALFLFISSQLACLTIIFNSKQIRWENRLRFDNGNVAKISVDGTDYKIRNPTKFWKGWYSHKFNGPGLRYEVGIAIQSGDIVWVHGPFPPGRFPDLTIF